MKLAFPEHCHASARKPLLCASGSWLSEPGCCNVGSQQQLCVGTALFFGFFSFIPRTHPRFPGARPPCSTVCPLCSHVPSFAVHYCAVGCDCFIRLFGSLCSSSLFSILSATNVSLRLVI